MEKLLKLVKLSLSISEESIIKDDEIKLNIKSAIKDIERQGIRVDTENPLIISAIVMYVKGNFGNTDIKQKEYSLKAYNSLCFNLGLSTDYKENNND